jgi:hypothetical protein
MSAATQKRLSELAKKRWANKEGRNRLLGFMPVARRGRNYCIPQTSRLRGECGKSGYDYELTAPFTGKGKAWAIPQ